MRTKWHRALLVSFFLIMSSLAGCIGTDDEEDKDDELQEGQYGTVMVSTYHVGEIVKAIAGDTLNVQMMSQNNIPVHDYTPTLDDIVRLSDADLFLHHGLGLEPWVDSTLEGLGSEAPEYIEGGVHTMPTGEISLDYETMLVDKLCDSISNPSTTEIHMLAEHAEDAEELHGDDGAHNLGFPEDDHEGEHEEGDVEGDLEPVERVAEVRMRLERVVDHHACAVGQDDQLHRQAKLGRMRQGDGELARGVRWPKQEE